MKKITSKNLTNRLSKYGALSIAIAGVANANGQVIYTDIADVTLDGANPSYALDLDNGGTQDYLLRVNTPAGTPFAFLFPTSGGSGSTSLNSNGIVGFSSGPYNYPSNLTSGAPINDTTPLMATGVRGDMNWNGCLYSGSQFCDGLDGFLGFSFEISSNIHYGWARVQVSSDATTMIVKDYAYNTVAGETINAGQQTISIDEFAGSQNYIVSYNNQHISISNINSEVSYKLISITGQSVLEGKTASETHTIDASSLASGVYIIEISNPVTNAVYRKKIAF